MLNLSQEFDLFLAEPQLMPHSVSINVSVVRVYLKMCTYHAALGSVNLTPQIFYSTINKLQNIVGEIFAFQSNPGGFVDFVRCSCDINFLLEHEIECSVHLY